MFCPYPLNSLILNNAEPLPTAYGHPQAHRRQLGPARRPQPGLPPAVEVVHSHRKGQELPAPNQHRQPDQHLHPKAKEEPRPQKSPVHPFQQLDEEGQVRRGH